MFIVKNKIKFNYLIKLFIIFFKIIIHKDVFFKKFYKSIFLVFSKL
jgi:hypothetical protein